MEIKTQTKSTEEGKAVSWYTGINIIYKKMRYQFHILFRVLFVLFFVLTSISHVNVAVSADTISLRSEGYTCEIETIDASLAVNKCIAPDGSETLGTPDECIAFSNPLNLKGEIITRVFGAENARLECKKRTITFPGDNDAKRDIWASKGGFFSEPVYLYRAAGKTIGAVEGFGDDFAKVCGVSDYTTRINIADNVVKNNGDINCIGLNEESQPKVSDFEQLAKSSFSTLETVAADASVEDNIGDTSEFRDNGDGTLTDVETGREYTINSNGSITDKETGRSYTTGGSLIQVQNNSSGGNGLADIIKTIFNLILAILIIIVWVVGWGVHTVFWLIANAFLIIVRVNPAAEGLINVATNPWRIVIQVANVLVLASFTFVGFGYLLDIKQIKKQLKVSEFLVNIVIIAVAMNFTLAATTTFVNIVQGVGDLVYFSYVTNTNVNGESGSQVAINNISDSLSKVSEIRCGNLSETAADCQVNNVSDTFAVTFQSGEKLTVLIKEVVYVLIILYAIFIFLKALRLALFRAIGIWLLMITSPLALVMFLSPIDKMKKYAKEWLEMFWSMTLFYPAFVFGLILINSLAGSFESAVRDITDQTVASNTILGGVSANAAVLSEGQITKLVLALLSGVVSIFALQVLVDFFEKKFGDIASGALNAVTGAIGQTLRGGGAIAAAGIGLRNRLVDGGQKKKLDALKNKNKLDIKNLNAKTVAEAKAGKLTEKTRKARLAQINALRQKTRDADKDYKKKQSGRQRLKDRTQGAFNTAGDLIESTDDILKGFGEAPAAYWENLNLGKKGRQARLKERAFDLGERIARGNKKINGALKLSGFDMDLNPNWNRYTGLGPDEMKKIKKERGDDYFAEEGKARAKLKYDQTTGKKTDYDTSIAGSLLKSLSDEVAQSGGASSMSADTKEKYRSLLKQSIQDDNLRNQILNDPNLVDLVQDQYALLNDPKVESIVANKAPVLHGDEDARARFAADAGRKSYYRKQIDADNFKYGDFARVAQANGLSNKDLRGLVPGSKGLGELENISSKKENKTEKSLDGDKYVDTYSGLDAGETKEVDYLTDGAVAKGLTFEDEYLSAEAQIDADDEINEKKKFKLKEEALKKYERRYFGTNNIDTKEGLRKAIDSGTFQKSDLGKQLIKSGNLTDSDTDKNKLFHAANNIRNNYLNTMYGRDYTGEGKNAYVVADGKYKTVMSEGAKIHTGGVREKKGATEPNNNIIKLNNEMNKLEDAQSIVKKLKSDTSMHDVYGTKEVTDGLRKEFANRDTIKVGSDDDSITYKFDTLSTKERNQFSDLTSRYIAAKTGKKDKEANIIMEKMKADFKDNNQAKDFINQQLDVSSSQVFDQVRSKGEKKSQELARQIESRAKKGNPPKIQDVRRVLNNNNKELKNQNKSATEKINKKIENIEIGDADRSLYGTEDNNIDTSALLGGGGGNYRGNPDDPNDPFNPPAPDNGGGGDDPIDPNDPFNPTSPQGGGSGGGGNSPVNPFTGEPEKPESSNYNQNNPFNPPQNSNVNLNANPFATSASPAPNIEAKYKFDKSSPVASPKSTYNYKTKKGKKQTVTAQQIVSDESARAKSNQQPKINANDIDNQSFSYDVFTNEGGASIVSPIKNELGDPNDPFNPNANFGQQKSGNSAAQEKARKAAQEAPQINVTSSNVGKGKPSNKSNQSPKKPKSETPKPQSTSFSDNMKIISQLSNVDGFKGFQTNPRNMNIFMSQGYSQDQARQMDFVGRYLASSDPAIKRINSQIPGKLDIVERGQFKMLLDKSKSNTGLSNNELLQFSALLSK